MVHIIALHEDGSNNPIGVRSNIDKVPFYNHYVVKDLYGLIIFIVGLCALSFLLPYYFGDAENFKQANPLVAPVHIKPE